MNANFFCKKAKYAVTFLLMFVAIATQAQSILTGKVVTQNQEVLDGATVSILELNKTTFTNDQGVFNIEAPEGNYTVKITFIGFKTIEQTVSTNEANNIFKLTSQTNVLSEVLVSATRATSKTPVTFTNVTKEELESRNLGQDLPILLDQLPSVVTTSDAGAGVGYTGIRVRGSDATRVNVTINGIPYNDSESQGTYWVNMPDFSSSIEDIQLQRGVGTSTNGAGAFGASLNINTSEATEEATASTSHSIGSFNTRKHNVNVSTGIKNNYYANARVSQISSDGYIDRSASELTSYFLEGGYVTEKTKLKAIHFGGHEITQQAWYGTPEAVINKDASGIQDFLAHEDYSFSDAQIANLNSNPGRTYNHYTYNNEVDNYKQKHTQLHWNQILNENYSFNISGNYTTGEGYFEQFKPKEKVKDYFPNSANASEKGEVIRRRWLANKFYAIVYSVNYNKENLDLTLGGGYNLYDGDHFGKIIWDSFPTEQIDYKKQYYYSSAEKTEFNTYTKAEYSLNKNIHTYLDLQYRVVSHTSTGTRNSLAKVDLDKSYNFFNPKAGLTYTFDKNSSAYASFAIANREPNRGSLIKNATMPKPERLEDLEVGYKFKNNKAYFNSNIYYMNYKDQLVLTGEIDDTSNGVRQNVDESYRLGIELQAGYKFSDKIQFDVNTTLSKNKIKEFNHIIYDTQYDLSWTETTTQVVTKMENTDISFSPSITSNAVLTYTPIKNISLAWISKYVGKQYLDNTNSEDKKINAYFLNNFNASYKINPSWIDEISINLLVNNVLNKEYVSNGYTYSYFYRAENSGDPAITEKFYYPQATRNFLLGATFKF